MTVIVATYVTRITLVSVDIFATVTLTGNWITYVIVTSSSVTLAFYKVVVVVNYE